MQNEPILGDIFRYSATGSSIKKPVFMRVCGLFSVSKKDWCPITVIPVFRDICKTKRSFHLIFRLETPLFCVYHSFFPLSEL